MFDRNDTGKNFFIIGELMQEKEIKDFDPTNLEFTFNFTKETCPKLKTGICDLEEIELILDKKIDEKHLRNLSRCQRIYFGLRDKTIRVLPPQIMKCKCGHYVCSDGQHRICVAQNKNLKLDVHIFQDIDRDCEKCMPIPENKNATEVVIGGVKFNIIK